MIRVEHEIPSMPREFPRAAACDVIENGVLVIYRDGGTDFVQAGFAPGTWASFSIEKD